MRGVGSKTHTSFSGFGVGEFEITDQPLGAFTRMEGRLQVGLLNEANTCRASGTSNWVYR
ncbi:hypothetical protein STANM309S_05612 [Streptomyces tanashiensis]